MTGQQTKTDKHMQVVQTRKDGVKLQQSALLGAQTTHEYSLQSRGTGIAV